MNGTNQTLTGLMDCEIKLNAASGFAHRVALAESNAEDKEEIQILLKEINHVTDCANKLRLKLLSRTLQLNV